MVPKKVMEFAVHPRIVKLTDQEREGEDLILQSTACWRGYQGTWEIKEGRFYLVDLRGACELREGDPIHADWFSGVLRIPRGDFLGVRPHGIWDGS